MAFINALIDCLFGNSPDDLSSRDEKTTFLSQADQKTVSLSPTDEKTTAISHTDDKKAPAAHTDSKFAAEILQILIQAEQQGSKLTDRVNAVLVSTPHPMSASWYESLAERILTGIEAILNANKAIGAAMQDAYEKARDAADEFKNAHPVLAAALVTLIALGILALLLPWVLEALGFGELGPVEGSWAAAWQSTFPDVPAGSWFAWLQRVGMTWGKA